MALGIVTNGIVQRQDEGGVIIYRPGKNGGLGTLIDVGIELADAHRLATGDVVEGETLELQYTPDTMLSDECMEDAAAWDEQRDEPNDVRGVSIPIGLSSHVMPGQRLVSISQINGLSPSEAEERPSPRRKRHSSERSAPERWLSLATGRGDTTGRLLDFTAALGRGDAGMIFGPHGSGLTRTLRAVVHGIAENAPETIVLLLLLRARGEELTDWRRRFPDADVIVCPTPFDGAMPEQTLHMADLVMEAALRQTELGRHVLLAVDSLTGLWGAMLEVEAADAQRQADRSHARQRLREWIQRAGNFGGAGLLGSGLGGSLTLIGTVWNQDIDTEAEEEHDIHPHLRLFEHLLHETSWRVPLSGELANARSYPAIETTRGFSQHEAHLLPAETLDLLRAARGVLTKMTAAQRYNALLDALEETGDMTELTRRLAPDGLQEETKPKSSNWLLW